MSKYTHKHTDTHKLRLRKRERDLFAALHASSQRLDPNRAVSMERVVVPLISPRRQPIHVSTSWVFFHRSPVILIGASQLCVDLLPALPPSERLALLLFLPPCSLPLLLLQRGSFPPAPPATSPREISQLAHAAACWGRSRGQDRMRRHLLHCCGHRRERLIFCRLGLEPRLKGHCHVTSLRASFTLPTPGRGLPSAHGVAGATAPRHSSVALRDEKGDGRVESGVICLPRPAKDILHHLQLYDQ